LGVWVGLDYVILLGVPISRSKLGFIEVSPMAPGRKRGASKAKAKGQLVLGDLVLAKVKGFPAWPAKVRYHYDSSIGF